MKTIRLMIVLFAVILTSTAKAQTEEVFYSPKLPQVEMSVAKANLEYLLKLMSFPNDEKNYWYRPESVFVSDDGFFLSFKSPMKPIVFNFCDLHNYKIEEIRIHNKKDKSWEFEIRLGKLIISVHQDKLNGWKIADYLYFFQQQHIKPMAERLVLFEPIAKTYRAKQIKPSISEDQRKFIVQANLLNQRKEYSRAIALYLKAIEPDPTSYPSAYTNLALLSAQLNDYQSAIFYMKKYLMLEPVAADARSCQDKIYEWEIMMQE